MEWKPVAMAPQRPCYATKGGFQIAANYAGSNRCFSVFSNEPRLLLEMIPCRLATQ